MIGMLVIVSLRRKKDEPDALFERLNRYHPNIVFTVEENPDHFLDTAFSYTNKFNCSVFKKPGKLPTHWNSEVHLHNGKSHPSLCENRTKDVSSCFMYRGSSLSFVSKEGLTSVRSTNKTNVGGHFSLKVLQNGTPTTQIHRKRT